MARAPTASEGPAKWIPRPLWVLKPLYAFATTTRRRKIAHFNSTTKCNAQRRHDEAVLAQDIKCSLKDIDCRVHPLSPPVTMPPRKSDLSQAHFVPVDPDMPATPSTTASTKALAPPAMPQPASALPPARESSATGQSASAEKKDKEKDGGPVTIEVRPSARRVSVKRYVMKVENNADRALLRAQDLTLPKSIITRLAKGVLPPNTQIQANAILAMTKSASVFINHLANACVAPCPSEPRAVSWTDTVLGYTAPTSGPPWRARRPSCPTTCSTR